MANYLGEEVVDVQTTKFKNYNRADWTMHYLERYSQIDGAHHKQWVLDQIARIISGTPVIVTEAKWDSGQKEYRTRLGEPSEDYKYWVNYMKGPKNSDGEYEYDYDYGIAP